MPDHRLPDTARTDRAIWVKLFPNTTPAQAIGIYATNTSYPELTAAADRILRQLTAAQVHAAMSIWCKMMGYQTAPINVLVGSFQRTLVYDAFVAGIDGSAA